MAALSSLASLVGPPLAYPPGQDVGLPRLAVAGGTLEIESLPGQTTRVRLSLPRPAGASSPEPS